MQKKLWVIVNAFVLFVLFVLIIGTIWSFSFQEDKFPLKECVEINKDPSFVYDACYDAYSKNIFLKAKRGFNNYKINTLDISFFDFIERSYKLSDVPNNGDFGAYKIPAEKNPRNIDIRLNIVNNLSLLICKEPKRVFVKYCPSSIDKKNVSKNGINISVSPLDNVSFEDFIDVSGSGGQDSDIFSLDLINREKIWKSQCRSSWNCEEWEPCIDNIRKRGCEDTNKCYVSTDMPITVARCNNSCIEKWKCEWSSCNNDFTVPNCKDLNNCGTSYNIPKKLSCKTNNECVIDVKCYEWSNCEVKYSFMDLVGNNIEDLYGVKSRVCIDKNNCINAKTEEEKCSIGVDIYTKQFVKCGESFIGIYDKLNNNLIVRIKDKTEINSYLSIYFRDEKDNEYCDYCFDGEMNGDEEEIDCGGSCKDCSDKYKQIIFKESLWDKFMNWFS